MAEILGCDSLIEKKPDWRESPLRPPVQVTS
jgi:hypothetical protein